MSKNALYVLAEARKQDKYVDWGMLMASCDMLPMSRMYLNKMESNGLLTVIREADVVKVILTHEGFLHAQLFLQAK